MVLLVLGSGPDGPAVAVLPVDVPLSPGDVGRRLAAMVAAMAEEGPFTHFVATADQESVRRIQADLGLPPLAPVPVFGPASVSGTMH